MIYYHEAMNGTFYGVDPGITPDMIGYAASIFGDFFKSV